uniref:Uncharacterized protein n=1 Tax=Oryza punctata TaxID=4537 RepID=A0A0E0JRX3_ORYPU
ARVGPAQGWRLGAPFDPESPDPVAGAAVASAPHRRSAWGELPPGRSPLSSSVLPPSAVEAGHS